MTGTINLAGKIEKRLPPELLKFMETAGKTASSRGQSLYVVGGAVRDLLLERANLDLDLVSDGDAIALVKELTLLSQGEITEYPQFGTAKLQWREWSIDFATARTETYAHPGALPDVKPGSLQDDLFRRDFSINAMAVYLTPDRYGELVDLYGGQDDLEHKLVHVLHEGSFVDDATRIWRALRYEQRFNFKMEAETERLLKRDIPRLDTISGDRIRNELERILCERHPEKVLRRAEELGVLSTLHPSLKADAWLAERFTRARQLTFSKLPPIAFYLALMVYRLTVDEAEELISQLRLPNAMSNGLRGTLGLKAKLTALCELGLPSSCVYRLLSPFSLAAVTVNIVASDDETVRQYLMLYWDALRYVKPELNGDDLLGMGIPEGPRIKEILDRLLEARLDGEVSTREGEVEVVKGWLDNPTLPA